MSAYHYLLVGRVRGFSNHAFSADLPATKQEAIVEFHAFLKDQHGSDYSPRDVVIDHILYSTDLIEIDDD